MRRAGDIYPEGQLQGGSADYFAIAPHGLATSHLDALCHIFYRGRAFNGVLPSEVTSTGANRLSIDVARDGIVSRGVLLDIPRLRGAPYLEPGDAITSDDLERAETAQGLRVQRGDILVIHTGRQARRAAVGPYAYGQAAAGLHIESARWLHDREIAVLGSDGVSEICPSPVVGVSIPIHVLALGAMGVHLLDNLSTDALAAACAERNRWEFHLTVAPLVLLRGTASPVNPIAVF